MATITLDRKRSAFKKDRFQDEYELYNYLREYLLVEKLHSLDEEESSGPMSFDESVTFLKSQ